MSPLRRRMIEDMTIRNLSPATQQSYVHAVSKFSQYFGRSPDQLGGGCSGLSGASGFEGRRVIGASASRVFLAVAWAEWHGLF